MSFLSSIGGFFGISPKGSQMNAADSATEDSIQAALDKAYGTPNTFGKRTVSASDAEKAMQAAGTLPPGWRLRESDSTSSGYRPTQAATKTMGAIHAAQIGAAAFTGGASLAGSGIGLGANMALQGGLGAAAGGASNGVKGALLGGALGAGGAYGASFIPGAPGSTAANLGKSAAVQGGVGAGGGVASGGGLKGALLGAATGAGGALAGNYIPGFTTNPLAQKAIGVGVNAGLNTARTGSFNPLGTALAAGSSFLPTGASQLSTNPWVQKAITYGGQQGLGAIGGNFSAQNAAQGAANLFKPPTAPRTAAPTTAGSNVYQGYLG